MIPSVFMAEQELLRQIIALHLPGGIELDPMYFKGNFYKEIERPRLVFDIDPLTSECGQADARHLGLPDGSVRSMILDPPFMFGIHGKTREYYSSRTHGILKDFAALESLYTDIIREAWRVLMRKGVLLFKCQDYTDNKTTMVHCHVWKWATDIGFYAKDLAILYLPKNKVYNPNLKQRHVRKVHSYFWVFTK